MKNGNSTTEVTDDEVNTTTDTAKGAQANAAKLPKGDLDPATKKFDSLLGHLNRLLVLKADGDLEGTSEIVVGFICLLDNSQCERDHGKGWVWDARAQKCVYVPTE